MTCYAMLARVLLLVLAIAPVAVAQESTAFKVLASNKTSTMQRELTAAAEAGYRFVSVMGGETAFGGNEVVALLQKTGSERPRFAYRVLATSKTSTMQKELDQLGAAGCEAVAMTVGQTAMGGAEIVVIARKALR